jgi:hypothetical protein
VAVTASAGDETLEVVLDGDLEVVRTERRPAGD